MEIATTNESFQKHANACWQRAVPLLESCVPDLEELFFFGPLLDQVRDLKVKLIAESVYEILDNLGYARLAL